MSLRQRHVLTDAPELVPPAALMRRQGVPDLETWFARGRDWSLLLSVFGGLTRNAWVLEIGVGLGENAYALRRALAGGAAYDGLEADPERFAWFDEVFAPAVPNFRFKHADMRSPEHRKGSTPPERFVYPYPDNTFDVIFSSMSFGRMAPDGTTQGLKECARMLKPGRRALIAVHLLDNFRPGKPRPVGFDTPTYEFSQPYRGYGESFALGARSGAFQAAACRLELFEKMIAEAGLAMVQPPVPGRWSGGRSFVAERDVLVLEKPR